MQVGCIYPISATKASLGLSLIPSRGKVRVPMRRLTKDLDVVMVLTDLSRVHYD